MNAQVAETWQIALMLKYRVIWKHGCVKSIFTTEPRDEGAFKF